MGIPYTRAPHQGGALIGADVTPHAALLIDFDNVTMGMRSDLSKELKALLDTDVIKGKVSVQRAYADWRRYPQYIVPLSEASVDLIFAPAYGSNKKNATDIRMAIDGMELVFTRPEIGTYILLTGDSDFSSLVLKLKEYGKYVIGVGIQESSSDILVQNCDEYYSYTSLTGLTKTTDLDGRARDPWVLVAEALKKMVQRKDVMRSDRLKQVMQELDTNFDEGGLGFSKFSKFLAEASSRGLIALKKLENGQYEVGPARGGRGGARRSSSDSSRGRGRGRGRRDERRGGRRESASAAKATEESSPTWDGSDDPLRDAYESLTSALKTLAEAGRHSVRDSDVKRKLLERDRGFDETELGFPKFSKFLQKAGEHGVVELKRTDTGNYEVSLPENPPELGTVLAAEAPEAEGAEESAAPEADAAADATSDATSEATSPAEAEADGAPVAEESHSDRGPTVVEVLPPDRDDPNLRLGPRRGSTRRRGADDVPLLFEGQIAGSASSSKPERKSEKKPERKSAKKPARDDRKSKSSDSAPQQAPAASSGDFDASALGLPSEPGSIVRYLAHRYKGVGERTAEQLVEKFGADLFRVMKEEPDSIASVVPAGRAEQVLTAWQADYDRRSGDASGS